MKVFGMLPAFVLLAAIGAKAQDAVPAQEPATAVAPDSTVCIVYGINAAGHITIVEPQGLTALVSRTLTARAQASAAGEQADNEAPAVVATRNGYRVQVFDDNNPGTARSQAERRRAQFENAFPQWRVYVTFNSPYWQVRVGDFRRRGEAEAALAQIREAMPQVVPYARIVAEKINISE